MDPFGDSLPIERWLAIADNDGVWTARRCARGSTRLQKSTGGMWLWDSGEKPVGVQGLALTGWA